MNQNCFACNIRAGIALRNAVNIFADQTPLQSGKSLVDVLSEIVERPIKEEVSHSKVLCKKCHKACAEYDSLQVRLRSIKTDFLGQFKKTLPSHNLNYETYNRAAASKSILLPPAERKHEAKKLVLPASKLQPLPPDFVIKSGKWPIVSQSSELAAKLNTDIRILSPSTLNLKVTVGSSVLTQSVKTTAALGNRGQQRAYITLPNQSIKTDSSFVLSPMKTDCTKTVNITDSVTSAEVATATSSPPRSTFASLLNTQSSSSILSFNVNSLPRDFLSSAILTKLSDCEALEEIVDPGKGGGSADETGSEMENNEETMEIEEDGSIAVITASEEVDKLVFGDTSVKNETENSTTRNLLNMNLVTDMEACGDESASGSPSKFVLGKIEILEGREEGRRTSVNSNDESQIELQVSGDEETANAIIAAAQEQGGAFIKVESGEMFRVKSVRSAADCESVGVAVEDERALQIVAKENGEFKCLLCENSGNKAGAFRGDAAAAMRHVRSAHDARVHICGECGAVLRRRADFQRHAETHSDLVQVDKSKVHECSICKKKFSSRQLLSEHSNSHSGARPHRCAVCGKTFASKYTYQSHLKTHLVRPRPFKCEQCGKSFLTQQNLNQHTRTHSGIKDFICKVCGKAFGTQHNLEVHGVVHSGNRPFVCGVCGKAFARRAEVRDHMRIHTGERPFSCEICGASFTQRSNLHSHRRATHLDDKRYKCQQCPKRFKRRRLLDYHIKASHTGERPLRCEVCDATFVYPEHYKKHIRIHSGEKPYVCEVCGKSFNSRDNRNTHRFVHSDKKPYECVMCAAGFMRKQLLYHHMNTAGHLAESIVVNQPRVTKVADNMSEATSIILDTGNESTEKFTDSIFEATNSLQLETTEKSVETASEDDNAAKFIITDGKKIIIQDGKSTINLEEGNDETPLLTLQNVDGELKEGTIIDTIPTELLDEDSKV